jgi:uncharacterized OsmC-like protein
MATHDIASAMQRVQSVLQRRPEMGLHDDAPAVARWQGGTRIASSHSNGTQVPTDMPAELGGTGDQVTPGWLFRAGIASCLATCIAMRAADAGIALSTLEVQASSRSDLRGFFGMKDAAGVDVGAGPCEFQLSVRIEAHGTSHEQLRKLVEESHRCSPMPSALRDAVPIALRIDTGAE